MYHKYVYYYAISASAKPSRRHVRKPAPLPPPALVKTSTRPRPYSDPSPLTSASTGAPTILTSEITAVEQPHVTEELRSTIPDTLVADARLEAVSPTGYNVHVRIIIQLYHCDSVYEICPSSKLSVMVLHRGV